MKSFVREFFATTLDLLPRIQIVESRQELQYVLMGMFKASTPVVFHSASEIPDLGIAKYGEGVGESDYMIMERGAHINVEKVPQRIGGVLYHIGLPLNMTSFVFQPAGLLGDRTIIRGKLGSATGNPTSAAMCKRFWRVIGKEFKRIGGYYYVGPEALRLLEQGWRLTASVQSPPEFDLRIEF